MTVVGFDRADGGGLGRMNVTGKLTIPYERVATFLNKWYGRFVTNES